MPPKSKRVTWLTPPENFTPPRKKTKTKTSNPFTAAPRNKTSNPFSPQKSVYKTSFQSPQKSVYKTPFQSPQKSVYKTSFPSPPKSVVPRSFVPVQAPDVIASVPVKERQNMRSRIKRGWIKIREKTNLKIKYFANKLKPYLKNLVFCAIFAVLAQLLISEGNKYGVERALGGSQVAYNQAVSMMNVVTSVFRHMCGIKDGNYPENYSKFQKLIGAFDNNMKSWLVDRDLSTTMNKSDWMSIAYTTSVGTLSKNNGRMFRNLPSINLSSLNLKPNVLMKLNTNLSKVKLQVNNASNMILFWLHCFRDGLVISAIEKICDMFLPRGLMQHYATKNIFQLLKTTVPMGRQILAEMTAQQIKNPSGTSVWHVVGPVIIHYAAPAVYSRGKGLVNRVRHWYRRRRNISKLQKNRGISRKNATNLYNRPMH